MRGSRSPQRPGDGPPARSPRTGGGTGPVGLIGMTAGSAAAAGAATSLAEEARTGRADLRAAGEAERGVDRGAGDLLQELGEGVRLAGLDRGVFPQLGGGAGLPDSVPPYSRGMKWSAKDCQLLAAELLQEGTARWQHVRRTAEVAAQLSARVQGSECVVSAAWLHDIGYAPALHRTGMHAIDGAEFLDREGAPHDLVSLVAFHTGAEFEAEERGLTGKLAQFDRPPQELLDALILADLTSGPTRQDDVSRGTPR